jgi:hypothetical protein
MNLAPVFEMPDVRAGEAGYIVGNGPAIQAQHFHFHS